MKICVESRFLLRARPSGAVDYHNLHLVMGAVEMETAAVGLDEEFH
jgi:hypothetical protein